MREKNTSFYSRVSIEQVLDAGQQKIKIHCLCVFHFFFTSHFCWFLALGRAANEVVVGFSRGLYTSLETPKREKTSTCTYPEQTKDSTAICHTSHKSMGENALPQSPVLWTFGRVP